MRINPLDTRSTHPVIFETLTDYFYYLAHDELYFDRRSLTMIFLAKLDALLYLS